MTLKVKHPISGFLEHSLERCSQLTRQLSAKSYDSDRIYYRKFRNVRDQSVLKNGKCLHVEGLSFCQWKPLWTGGQGRVHCAELGMPHVGVRLKNV